VFSNPFAPKPKDKKGKGSAANKGGAANKNGKPTPKGGRASAPRSGRGKGQTPPPPPPPPSMSLDTKLDILGIGLAFVGVITALSLFTANPTGAMLAWLNLLWGAVGWGVYGLPVFFLAAGLWLIVRKFGDRLPKFDPEQYVGVPLVYLAFLVSVHFGPGGRAICSHRPRTTGGGAVGAMILQALIGALGKPEPSSCSSPQDRGHRLTAGTGRYALLIASRVRHRVGEGVARQLPLPTMAQPPGPRPRQRPARLNASSANPLTKGCRRRLVSVRPRPPKSPDKPAPSRRPRQCPNPRPQSPIAPYDRNPSSSAATNPGNCPRSKMLDPGTEGARR
jgi:hypothetical protein